MSKLDKEKLSDIRGMKRMSNMDKLNLLANIYWLRFYRHMQYLNQGVRDAKWYNFYHPASRFHVGAIVGLIVVIIGLVVVL